MDWQDDRSVQCCSSHCRKSGWVSRAALAVFLLLCLPPCWGEPPLVIGIFPRESATITHDKFAALGRYFGNVLQREVRVETGRDFDGFWQGVAEQRYDLVHFNQYHYVKSHAQFGYRVVAKNEERGKATIAPAIAVRADSGITNVGVLRGRHIVFGGGPSAMVAYVGVKALLKQAGLQEGDYTTDTAINPPSALLAVYLRQAPAAGIGESALDLPTVVRRIDASKIRILAKGEEIPQLPWAVRGGADAALVQQIRAALLDLGQAVEGREILREVGVTGFVSAEDHEFDVCRRLILDVLGEQY